MADIGFAVLASLVVLASGMVTIARNLVHAVFWLAATLLASAGVMVWLGAPFIAGIQIVLYTGGVITLMLFAVMLTNRSASTEVPNPVQRPGAAVLASLTLLAILLSAIWNTPELEPEVVAARSVPAMRTFDAHLVVEREVVVPEDLASDPELYASDRLARRTDAFFAIRTELAMMLPREQFVEISANEDEVESSRARVWLRLTDPSDAGFREALRRLDGAGSRVVEVDVTAEVGRKLLTEHLLAFEALSVLLLAAMIGAIVLSRRKDP